MPRENDPRGSVVGAGITESAENFDVFTRSAFIETGYNLLSDPANPDKAKSFMDSLQSDTKRQTEIHGKKIRVTKELAIIKLEEVAKAYDFSDDVLESAKKSL